MTPLLERSIYDIINTFFNIFTAFDPDEGIDDLQLSTEPSYPAGLDNLYHLDDANFLAEKVKHKLVYFY